MVYSDYGFTCTLIRLCLPNLRNPAQFTVTTNSSRSPKVIDVGANRKRICSFLLIINSIFGRIYYRFRDIDAFSSNIGPISFSPSHPCLTPPSGGTSCDINIIYTLLESTFNGLQSNPISLLSGTWLIESNTQTHNHAHTHTHLSLIHI